MKTQQDRVLDILQARNNIGVTSQELRELTHIVDIPKVISILVDKGHKITSQPVKLGDSTIKRYWLGDTQPQRDVIVTDQDGKKFRVVGDYWQAL